MKIIKLNLARNCIKYLIQAYGINEIFIPYYTCQTVWTSAKEAGCKVKFYHIDKDFMPSIDFPSDAFILYTNYYGLCTKNCKTLAHKYPNIIIDNAHAFYAPNIGLANFTSLRKFIPVTNGAYLYTNRFIDENFKKDTLNLSPTTAQNDYKKFVFNELQLNKETKIMTISDNVENQISNFDFNNDKKIRQANFQIYEKYLKNLNNITLNMDFDEIPYCYPFSPKFKDVKTKIAQSGLTLIQLWKNFPQSSPESEFLNDTMALPLTDSKYLDKILSTILN